MMDGIEVADRVVDSRSMALFGAVLVIGVCAKVIHFLFRRLQERATASDNRYEQHISEYREMAERHANEYKTLSREMLAALNNNTAVGTEVRKESEAGRRATEANTEMVRGVKDALDRLVRATENRHNRSNAS